MDLEVLDQEWRWSEKLEVKAFGEKTVADWGCMSIVGAEVGKTEQSVPVWNIVGNVLYNFQKVLWKWSFVDCCYQVPKNDFAVVENYCSLSWVQLKWKTDWQREL